MMIWSLVAVRRCCFFVFAARLLVFTLTVVVVSLRFYLSPRVSRLSLLFFSLFYLFPDRVFIFLV